MANVEEHCWEQGWQGHELAQLKRMAQWSLREKILWLEEAARVAAHLQKQAMRHPSAVADHAQSESARQS